GAAGAARAGAGARAAGRAGGLRRGQGHGGGHVPRGGHQDAGRRAGAAAQPGEERMSTTIRVEKAVHFRTTARGRQELRAGPAPAAPAVAPGRVPRVARLLALAHRFEALLRVGEVASYAELARLGHVTPARISQVMNLLHLAPDLQEQLLFLRTERGRDAVTLAELQPIAATL